MDSTRYSYDAADRLTAVGATSYTYDNNGNLTARESDSFTWDAEDRMTASTISSTTKNYAYNGDGLMITHDPDRTQVWDSAAGLPCEMPPHLIHPCSPM